MGKKQKPRRAQHIGAVVIDANGREVLSREGLERLVRAVEGRFSAKDALGREVLEVLDLLLSKGRKGRPPNVFREFDAAMALDIFKKHDVSITDAVRAVIRNEKDFDKTYAAVKKLRREPYPDGGYFKDAFVKDPRIK